MEEKDYILFEDYLSGDLTTEESTAFEARLSNDKAFKEAFNIYKDLSANLEHEIGNEQQNKDFKANLDNISFQHFNKLENETETVSSKKTFSIYKLAVAASIALIMGFFVFNQFGDPKYEDYNNHESMSVVRDGSVKDLIEATKAFNNQEYELANKLIKKVLDKDPNNSELQLYYAITNIELDNFTIADAKLSELINGTSAYKDKALWYSALSRLKQRNIDACIVLLKQVNEDSDDYQQAQDLLDKLE